MPDQLDLFGPAGDNSPPFPAARPQIAAPPPETLSDAALIAAIPDATRATCRGLAGEAARRRLVAAVPALEALCRRFKGFGSRHAIPEQIASVRALASIGGADAAAAVHRILAGGVIEGPGEREAVCAAAALRCILPEATAVALLQHADPLVRARACRCAPRNRPIAELLISLLEDLNAEVAAAAAKALGRRGRAEARPHLVRLLQQEPDADLIDAIVPIADEDCTILLGRVARRHPALHAAVMAALEALETPRAAALLASLADRDESHVAG